MNIDTISNAFPGFELQASSLSKFVNAGNLFTILSKDGSIVHYEAVDKELFKKWLIDNKIRDVKF